MGRKRKTISPELLSVILKHAFAMSDMPFKPLDIDSETLDIDDFDIPLEELPEWPTLADRPVTTKAVPEAFMPGTQRICIRVPARTVQAFKAQATKSGTAYQTLMNRVLREAAEKYV